LAKDSDWVLTEDHETTSVSNNQGTFGANKAQNNLGTDLWRSGSAYQIKNPTESGELDYKLINLFRRKPDVVKSRLQTKRQIK